MHRIALLALAGVTLWSAACSSPATHPEPGVAADLARLRTAQLRDVRYDLSLNLPADPDSTIEGEVAISFELLDATEPVVLDFAAPTTHILSVEVGETPVDIRHEAEHLIIPSAALRKGPSTIAVRFRAGDAALNRREEYLYSLFVPERARTAFPCFDQPDLKGRFRLTLETPGDWLVVSNAPLEDEERAGDRARWRFAETRPLSTYQFAFAAGRFQTETAQRGGRTLRLFHRETDTERVRRNRETIFALHAEALAWLESYTDVPYPFDKFDVVLLPAFQFGGMEHPGSIFYNASSLFLEEPSTLSQQMGRASLIAHETAHMWFGDLVTMRWFDDVWTKEVFANFFASKIVNPQYPDIDHDLSFYLRHIPLAYAVDRTAGTHPIRQQLDNLNDAASLYGAIIYQKAPVVMRQLEQLLGEEELRDGLRVYLQRFAYGNATWRELVRLLDTSHPGSLAAWSFAWVEEAGRPAVSVRREVADDGSLQGIRIDQRDTQGRSRLWSQPLEVALAYPGDLRQAEVFLRAPGARLPVEPGFPPPDFILPDASGLAYGLFEPDSASLSGLLRELPDTGPALVRATGWVTLYDNLLEGRVAPVALLELAMRLLPKEPSEPFAERLLQDVRTVFWRFLEDGERQRLAEALEESLWTLVETGDTPSLRIEALRAYRSLATTPEGIRALADLWGGELVLDGIELGEDDRSAIALELAVRRVDGWRELLDRQEAAIQDPERRAQFAFVRPAVDADVRRRDSLFQALAIAKNRSREPWALQALRLLHHPLRASESIRYIAPALELLPEIRRSGAIFFPERWIDATLGGHASPAAAQSVRDYLSHHPELPPRLRQKVLQSADLLFRAAKAG